MLKCTTVEYPIAPTSIKECYDFRRRMEIKIAHIHTNNIAIFTQSDEFIGYMGIRHIHESVPAYTKVSSLDGTRLTVIKPFFLQNTLMESITYFTIGESIALDSQL